MSRGFDALVGNPPFLGGKRISTNLGEAYRDWLARLHERSTSNADLAAHFFRRTFGYLRVGGTLGLIATNTISQGDTRVSGLKWILQNDGTIYCARRRIRWPGNAGVVVSTVHIVRGPYGRAATLDNAEVARVTAFLFHTGGDDDPATVADSKPRAFIGCDIKGQGFLFADDDEDCTPLEEMRRLLAKDPRNQNRVLPYLGGEDLNNSPVGAAARQIIFFDEMSLEEARQWPDLLTIVEHKVKPDRERRSADIAAIPWWQYWRTRRDLYSAIASLGRVIVIARVSRTCAFTMVSARQVFNEKVVVLASDRFEDFGILHSRIHEGWARFFSSTLKDDMQYTPSDCFETFPFPSTSGSLPRVSAVGKDYYDFRATLMVKDNEGLTKTYNRFHDPDERSSDIVALRELHSRMDRVVLDAYGWTDMQPVYDFREQVDETIRLTWGEETRDDVLARLLDLNRAMTATEANAIATTQAVPKPARKTSRRGRAKTPTLTLPGIDPEEA